MSAGGAEYVPERKKSRREVFLDGVKPVAPSSTLIKVISLSCPAAGRDRRSCLPEAVPQVRVMRSGFVSSDLSMQQRRHEIASLSNFVEPKTSEPSPDKTMILNLRYLLDDCDLVEQLLAQVNAYLFRKGLLLELGAIVDVTSISTHGSTGNAGGSRDLELHQAHKGDQGRFAMKAHIGVDADGDLVHTVTTTHANESDAAEVAEVLHRKGEDVDADSRYCGARRRVDRKGQNWHIAVRPSDVARMPHCRDKDRVRKEAQCNASIRPKTEHPLRLIKRPPGLAKARFRGLEKSTPDLRVLFALPNLRPARGPFMGLMGAVYPNAAELQIEGRAMRSERAGRCLSDFQRVASVHLIPTPEPSGRYLEHIWWNEPCPVHPAPRGFFSEVVRDTQRH